MWTKSDEQLYQELSKRREEELTSVEKRIAEILGVHDPLIIGKIVKNSNRLIFALSDVGGLG